MSKQITVNIVDVKHAGTSRNGNPTYDLITDTGETYRTASGAMFGYEASNYRPRRMDGEDHVTAVLTLERGRVVYGTLPDGTSR